MKTEAEVVDLRKKLDSETKRLETVIYKMRERIEIPQEAANVGFENYLIMLTNKKVLLEVQRDTLDWILGTIGE